MGNGRKKAILVDVIDLETSKEEAELRLFELESLVNTYGGIVVLKTIQKRGVPDYSTYVGKGKVDEIMEMVKDIGADLVVVNNLLKARQIFNLEEKFQKSEYKELKEVKVWDRVDLILKIFDKHAKSTEAKLQIELASIRHMGPRIFNMGIELMQQTGAIGQRGGQGESNIELMKRHLRKQELEIESKLSHYEAIREGHRNRRKRQNFKTLALVGYTNAGKSSILNCLTKKGAYVADQLFATLDTRVGKFYLPNIKKEILLSDTIGFIQDLPPSLIKAFKSTLSETIDADILMHVIDVTDPQIDMKIKCVEEILEQLGAGDKEKIYVFNKTDLIQKYDLPEQEIDYLDREEYPGLVEAGDQAVKILGWEKQEQIAKEFAKKTVNSPKKLAKKYAEFTPVFVSAHEKDGIGNLIEVIEKRLEDNK